MAISSICFQQAKQAGLDHMMRRHKHEPHYLLPQDERLENEGWEYSMNARQLYDEQMAKLAGMKGKRPKFESCVWEGVLNLNANHNANDVARVARLIEERTHTKCIAFAIHRDEGHIDKQTGVTKYNYHAHLQFFTYMPDKEGGKPKQQWRLKHIQPLLSQLQTDIAKELGMERGKTGSKRKHLAHEQYRQIADEREKLVAKIEETNDAMHDANELARRACARERRAAGENADLRKRLGELEHEHEAAHARADEADRLYREAQDAQDDLQQKLAQEKIARAEEQRKHDAELAQRLDEQRQRDAAQAAQAAAALADAVARVREQERRSAARALRKARKQAAERRRELAGRNAKLQAEMIETGKQKSELEKQARELSEKLYKADALSAPAPAPADEPAPDLGTAWRYEPKASEIEYKNLWRDPELGADEVRELALKHLRVGYEKRGLLRSVPVVTGDFQSLCSDIGAMIEQRNARNRHVFFAAVDDLCDCRRALSSVMEVLGNAARAVARRLPGIANAMLCAVGLRKRERVQQPRQERQERQRTQETRQTSPESIYSAMRR